MSTTRRQMQTRYYVDLSGLPLGAFTGLEMLDERGQVVRTFESKPDDPNAVEVPTAPPLGGLQRWDGTQWVMAVRPSRDYKVEFLAKDDAMQEIINLLPGGKTAWKAKMTART